MTDMQERAAKVADGFASKDRDCPALGFMDPETGARECGVDTRGGTCLCDERNDEATEIAKAIRALPANPTRAALEECVRAMERVIVSAKLLRQQMEGCIVDHHGHDFNEQGWPGWILDCSTDIDNAETALATARNAEAK